MEDYSRRPLKDLGLAGPPKTGPAILLYDLETAPALCWDWSPYQSNVVAVEQPPFVLCFAYKWLGQKQTRFVSIVQDPAFAVDGCILCSDNSDDLWVAERLAALFHRAHITVAHNGDRFDRKKANSMFLSHQLDPPSPYQTIDILKETKRSFAEFKNNLAELGVRHGLGEKVPHHGFGLWRDCMLGDPKAWRLMERYNRQDVKLLEKWYLTIRPWIGQPGKKAHPNLGFWSKLGEVVCPKCGSPNVHRRGVHRTTVSEFGTIQCQDCRGYSRLRVRDSQRGQTAAAKVEAI